MASTSSKTLLCHDLKIELFSVSCPTMRMEVTQPRTPNWLKDDIDSAMPCHNSRLSVTITNDAANAPGGHNHSDTVRGVSLRQALKNVATPRRDGERRPQVPSLPETSARNGWARQRAVVGSGGGGGFVIPDLHLSWPSLGLPAGRLLRGRPAARGSRRILGRLLVLPIGPRRPRRCFSPMRRGRCEFNLGRPNSAAGTFEGTGLARVARVLIVSLVALLPGSARSTRLAKCVSRPLRCARLR